MKIRWLEVQANQYTREMKLQVYDEEDREWKDIPYYIEDRDGKIRKVVNRGLFKEDDSAIS